MNSMFPMKEKSDQTVFSFLNLILLMQASVDRLTLNYCNKNPPDTPSIPIDSLNRIPDFPNVQVNHGAEGSIGRWSLLPHIGPKQGNNNLNSGTLLRKPWKTSRGYQAFCIDHRERAKQSRMTKFKDYFGTAQTSR